MIDSDINASADRMEAEFGDEAVRHTMNLTVEVSRANLPEDQEWLENATDVLKELCDRKAKRVKQP